MEEERKYTPSDVRDEEKKPIELNPKSKLLIVPVEIPGSETWLAEQEIGGKKFEKKPEFHITVIGIKRGQELKKLFAERPELEAELNGIIRSFDWRVKVLPEKYLIKQDREMVRQLSKADKKQRREQDLPEINEVREMVHRESIIQMAELPAFEDFFEKLRTMGIDLGEVPPIHITLYTHGDASGIAINSKEDWNKLKPEELK